MPNLVTGDLSLSDAIYSLIAMEGQGFYYDCPIWKIPTMNALIEILNNTSKDLANVFIRGSYSGEIDHNNIEVADHTFKKALNTFIMHQDAEIYRKSMRTALVKEIVKRFGYFEVYDNGFPDGLYIKRGAPFLFQDATESVIAKLYENPDLFAEIEKTRRELAAGKSTISNYIMDEKDLLGLITKNHFNTPELIDK